MRILLVCGCPGFFSRQKETEFVHLLGTMLDFSGMFIISVIMSRSVFSVDVLSSRMMVL